MDTEARKLLYPALVIGLFLIAFPVHASTVTSSNISFCNALTDTCPPDLTATVYDNDGSNFTGNFNAGDTITVSGSTFNNGMYNVVKVGHISSTTQDYIEVSGTFITEATGTPVTIDGMATTSTSTPNTAPLTYEEIMFMYAVILFFVSYPVWRIMFGKL